MFEQPAFRQIATLGPPSSGSSDARAVLVREMLEAGELTAMFDEKGVAYDKTKLLA